MKRCPKCGCGNIVIQQNVRTGYWSIKCDNLFCEYTSKERPFRILAIASWDKEKREYDYYV